MIFSFSALKLASFQKLTQKGFPVVRATHDSTMASCVKLRYLIKPGEMFIKEPSHSPTDIYLYAYVLDLTQSGDIGHAQI